MQSWAILIDFNFNFWDESEIIIFECHQGRNQQRLMGSVGHSLAQAFWGPKTKNIIFFFRVGEQLI